MPARTSPSQRHLRIVHVNDVYELDNFPSIKTIIDQYTNQGADKDLVFLGGDFLAPSLLSSLDHGRGMVDIMNRCGFTHVCLGNHEADVPIRDLKQRIAESQFKWINTNMRELDEKIGVKTLSHDLIDCGNGRKVGLLGLLTEDPCLYRPGAFADAKIDPVLSSTDYMLGPDGPLSVHQSQHKNIDVLVPITHQRMPQDRAFCERYGSSIFPIVPGGHDHEFYDEQNAAKDGSRVIKVGMDANKAAIIDLRWDTDENEAPGILAHECSERKGGANVPVPLNRKVSVEVMYLDAADFDPCPEIARRCEQHLMIVQELSRATLFTFQIPQSEDECEGRDRRKSTSADLHRRLRMTWVEDPETSDRRQCPKAAFRMQAFSTKDNRLQPSTGSRVLITAMRRALRADCAICNAGSIRCNRDYSGEEKFTWSDLKAEFPFPDTMTLAFSRQGAYQNPPVSAGGYLQVCDMISFNDRTQKIGLIRGRAFDAQKLYLTGLPVNLLRGLDRNEPLLEWWKSTGIVEYVRRSSSDCGSQITNDTQTPVFDLSEEVGRPMKVLIAEFFSAALWLQLGSFDDIDEDNDGRLSKEEIRKHAVQRLGQDVGEMVVENVMALADTDGDGMIDPLEMLNVRFIASDMLSHVSTSCENPVMLRLAGELLDLAPHHPDCLALVEALRNKIDANKDGRMTRDEAICALGALKAERLLSR
eukprot:Clim_evm17s233 gene=Clim_evmTU17s233